MTKLAWIGLLTVLAGCDGIAEKSFGEERRTEWWIVNDLCSGRCGVDVPIAVGTAPVFYVQRIDRLPMTDFLWSSEGPLEVRAMEVEPARPYDRDDQDRARIETQATAAGESVIGVGNWLFADRVRVTTRDPASLECGRVESGPIRYDLAGVETSTSLSVQLVAGEDPVWLACRADDASGVPLLTSAGTIGWEIVQGADIVEINEYNLPLGWAANAVGPTIYVRAIGSGTARARVTLGPLVHDLEIVAE